jgi:hypothetical protein
LLLSSVVGVLVLHVVRTDLSPLRDRLSEYANGDHGLVMTISFFTLGAGIIGTGLVMRSTGPRRGLSRLVPFAVIAAGGGMVLSGVYRTDPLGTPTTSERVHSLASGSATVALIGAAVTSSALAWAHRPRRPIGPVGVVAGAALVLGAASPILHQTDWTGLSQRLLWLTLTAWLLMMTYRAADDRVGGRVPP